MKSAFLFLLIAGIATAAVAEPQISKSFEQSYVELQKKMDDLRARGEKVSASTQKQIDDLMAQMNHEHAELKRQLAEKNQELNEKVREGERKKEDWSKRFERAANQIKAGFSEAWKSLAGDDKS